MKFEQYLISKELKMSLEELGFKRPTDIQYKAIPSILKGEDVLAIAQTGTGKTAAFAIPVIQKLQQALKRDKRSNHIRCLVMVPTRELAVQITGVFEKLARYTTLQVFCTFGGVAREPQVEELEMGVDILVSTPGRMFDLKSQGFIDLGRTEILVLDEADHMLALGFLQDIHDVVRCLPRQHQTLFFSATIDQRIKEVAYDLVRNAIRIQISPKDPVSKNVTHAVMHIEMDDKRFFLERLIRENPGIKVLVFVRTRVRADRVQKAMERVGIHAESLHGEKLQEERFDVLQRFREDKNHVLIATDVSSRGIDIPEVKLVINYDVPDVPENYVHRVGRTGRGMEKGKAISFCAAEEKELLKAIEKFVDKPITEIPITRGDYELTKLVADEEKNDWKKLIRDAEQVTTELQKSGKIKRKKK